MAEQMRPASNAKAPDPSDNYERAHPSREGGLTDNASQATPDPSPDRQSADAVANDPQRQINAQDSTRHREHAISSPAAKQPDHSMHDEEPMGWDQAPMDIKDPEQKRHPRKEGKGGTP